MSKIQLIAGTSHPQFARKLAAGLKIELSPAEIKKFANGEIYTRILNKVRGDDIFIIQSLCPPVNDNLMELLILIDSLKRASAGRINLICPNMCYSRQDRKTTSREPITARLVADLITVAGANRLLTVDLHDDQIQGFYNLPVDHLVGYPLFAKYFKRRDRQDLVIVSPDIGGVKRANKMADLLGLPIAVIDKIRKRHNCAEVAHVVGEVKGKTAIIIDDIIDTAGSITEASKELKQRGAKEIFICATHGFLSGDAVEKIKAAPVSKVLLLDTVPLKDEAKINKIKIISLAPLLVKVIRRIHQERSLGQLFSWEDQRRSL